MAWLGVRGLVLGLMVVVVVVVVCLGARGVSMLAVLVVGLCERVGLVVGLDAEGGLAL